MGLGEPTFRCSNCGRDFDASDCNDHAEEHIEEALLQKYVTPGAEKEAKKL